MKIQVKDYTFNKTSKTVTFTDYTSIDLDSILLITNVTDNIIIYNFADPLLGGTVTNNVLTLTYNTSTMDNGDKLQIFYEDSTLNNATSESQTTLNSLIETLQELSSRLAVLASVSNAGTSSLRITPAAATVPVSGTLTSAGTVSTVTAVTTLTNFGTGVPAKEMADDFNNLLAVQANINNAVSA